jgi:hypothetical protein
MSSVITISQPPSVPGDEPGQQQTEMTFSPVDPDAELTDSETMVEIDAAKLSGSESSDVETGTRIRARDDSLAKLQGAADPTHRETASEASTSSSATRKVSAARAKVKRKPKDGPDAVIVLKEERVRRLSSFCQVLSTILHYRQAHSTISSNSFILS